MAHTRPDPTDAALPQRFTLQIGARGRLVLPAAVRKRIGVDAGDALLLTLEEDGRVSLVSVRDQARRCRGLLKATAKGRSLSAELLAERRAEARRA